MKRRPTTLRNDDGQALVEFALVTPLLLLLILGIIEFGHAWSMTQVITDAARQGARTAAVLNSAPGATEDSVVHVTERALAAGRIDYTKAQITVQGFQAGMNRPATVSVAVPFNFGAFGPVMRLAGQAFGSDNITLRSSAVMRNE